MRKPPAPLKQLHRVCAYNNIPLDNQTTLQPKRKHVQFAKRCEVKHTISRMDMTLQEKKNYWLDDAELRNVFQSNLEIASQTNFNDRRGLEIVMQFDAERRRLNQMKSRNAVFGQQNFGYNRYSSKERLHQYDNNDVAIALAYQQISQPCQIQAFSTAWHDHIDAR